MTTKQEHLSDYERAIYYYTLPKVTTPFPVGVVVVYGVMLCLAVGALVYGVSTQQSDWMRSGTVGLCFGGIVGAGAFLLRDFLNQVRQRSALSSARGVPDADSQFEDIPDPFREHTLLRIPIRHAETTMPLVNNKGKTLYTADLDPEDKSFTLHDASGEPLFQAVMKKHSHSFSFENGGAPHVRVLRGDEEIAEIVRRRSEVDIRCKGDEENQHYTCQSGGLYLDEVLVGRVYEVRGYHYLDIESKHLDEGILAFFTTIG